MTPQNTSPKRRLPLNLTWLGLVAVSMFMLAACSGSDSSTPTQAVAKVSKQEITELQLNQVLERQAGLKPEQVDAAQRKALANLVDQQLLVQKAQELKLDREQRVVQAIESAKRDLIARAYLDRVADGAAKPTPEAVRQYYQDKPALFKERRIFSFQELNVNATAEQRADIEQQLKLLKSPTELEAYIKAKQIPVRAEQSTVAAENVPLPLLEKLASMKRGQGLVLPTPTGLRIVLIANLQEAPVAEEQARPAIEAFLLNEQKRKTVEKEITSLRSATKVEYYGKFADMPASAAARTAAAASAASEPAGRGAAGAAPASAAAQVAAPAPRAPASSGVGGGLDAASVNNAISGLK